MNSKNNSGILKKVEELKALLVFSRRIIPFMEDVLTFVKDIVPVVEALKSSVEMSSDKLPKASKQLDKVTMATEMASTEILNLVEVIFGKIEKAQQDVADRKARFLRVREAAKHIDDLLTKMPAAPQPMAQVAGSWAELVRALDDYEKSPIVQETLSGIQEDCTNIMIALQVQDITAQQIAAVNKLMESVDEGLNRMLKNFRETAGREEGPGFAHPRLDISHDTTAEYTGSEERQRMADHIIELGVSQQSGKTPKKKRTGAGGA